LQPKNPEDIEKGHCISINTVDGSAFWQEHDFLANSSGNGLIMLRRVDLTERRALFLCAAITAALNASYTVMLTTEAILDVALRLPVTSGGDPDWEYMEQTMHNALTRQEHRLDSLWTFSTLGRVEIDTRSWIGFKVGNLFNIKPTRAYKTINSELFDADGSNPVVVNSAYNNGIGGFTKRSTTEAGGIITFSDTTTSEAVFYQRSEFVGYPHVQGMYPIGKYAKEWNEERLLFFLSVFKKAAILHGFDYRDKFTRKLASSLVVRLPVTSGGDPDWEYMEQTMHNLVVESEASLDILQTLAVEPA
jgi:hypothetical protein